MITLVTHIRTPLVFGVYPPRFDIVFEPNYISIQTCPSAKSTFDLPSIKAAAHI